jgi:hypothetical protein
MPDSEPHHLNAGILAAPVETRRMSEYTHGLGDARKEQKQRCGDREAISTIRLADFGTCRCPRTHSRFYIHGFLTSLPYGVLGYALTRTIDGLSVSVVATSLFAYECVQQSISWEHGAELLGVFLVQRFGSVIR